jgi:hypothetical protein
MHIGVRGYSADCGIQPVVVYHIQIDTRTVVDRNKVLLFSPKIAYIDETSKTLLWLTAVCMSVSLCYTAECQLGHSRVTLYVTCSHLGVSPKHS